MSAPKRKASIPCCVVNCKNTSLNSPGVHFYRFPTATIQVFKRKRREDWIASVKRKNPDGSTWQPSISSRICSKHFVGNEKSEDPRSPSYNPTIFPAVYRRTKICEQSAIERYQRVKKRKSVETPQLPSTSNGRSRQTATAADENVFHNSIQQKESENGYDTLSVDRTGRLDQGMQVNFSEANISRYHQESSTCIRYIYIDSSTHSPRSTCDVQLQVNIPESTTTEKNIVKKPKTVNRSCGSYVTYEDKAVGPEADDNSDSSLKWSTGFHGVTSIKEDRQMLDLAGVTLPVFQLLLKILPASKDKKISRENRLLIFLFKIKCGLTYSALGVLFGIHRSATTRIFISTLQSLAAGTKQFVFWPSREIVQATMPRAFKENYSNCRVIIDCMEFRVEQPSTVDACVNLYSHCKKDFTLKVLIGCTPSGAISFISKCYGGRTTNDQITSEAGFLELLEPNDVVIANKGFPQIKRKLDESGKGVLLVMPPFSHNNTFSEEEVNETHRVASVRVHIERIMQRFRTYRILDKFTVKMLPYSDDIVFVCCVLVNLLPPIINE